LALLGPTVLDPAPRLPPLVRAAPAWSDLVVLGVITIVLVLAATAVARRRIRSLTTAEVLRGEE
jgi:ABC-type lipoprotein release transport system permease subunit